MSEINRSDWVMCFEAGYRAGVKERKRTPKNRRETLPREDRTDAEQDAYLAGYAAGKQSGYPGADHNIEDKAHKAYDRSEYSTGLGAFVGDLDE